MGNTELEQTKAYSHMDCAQPPAKSWERRFDDEGKKIAMFSMTLNDMMALVPFLIKVFGLNLKDNAKGLASVYDPLKKWMDNCYRGVPLGGIGAGSIGRSYKGYFQHFQIFPRIYEEKPILANQFSAFISRPDGKSYATVLSAPNASVLKGIDKAGIGSWDWKLKEKNCNYHGLFPRSWTVYNGEPDPEIKITCRQISPFIPHNYKESSFPVAVFTFTLHNSGSTPADITLLFTWANSVGGKSELTGNHTNSRMTSRDGVHGVLLHHRTAGGPPPVTFAIASQEPDGVRVTGCPRFTMGPSKPNSGDVTAKDMWDEIKKNGFFGASEAAAASRPGSSIGAAVAAATTGAAGGTRVVSFALSWACPEVKFPAGRTYHRRYTKFHGTDCDAAAERLAHDALLEHMKWESQIEEWQRPILQDKSLPEWYPITLFNELYYLNAGGTIWTEKKFVTDGQPPKNTSLSSATEPFNIDTSTNGVNGVGERSSAVDGIVRTVAAAAERASSTAAMGTALLREGEENVGQVLYLEGMEYNLWNTYDVHFYASFALLALFPELELNLQRDFIRAVLLHDPRLRHTLIDGVTAPRKVVGAVPHDMGLNDPWVELNAYMLHDPARWKDLNPKFVLQVYRDVLATADAAFAQAAWPAVYLAMAYMDQFDRDRDAMARRALATVLDYNVMRVGGGAIGAVNGMQPDGTVDASSTQSKEVWPGVTYAVAAAMIHEGMPEAAFRTAKGIHDAGWSKDGFGYAFQTPEAWTTDGRYRALHYMRPLAVWAMQWALSPPVLHKDIRLAGATTVSPDTALGQEKFDKVASMLRLPEEKHHKGILRTLFDVLRQLLLPA
uniref:Non-lysosomal glucosylceramidase n=1 Tax=Oryza brachyantha TaxID=4533 RepID=J3MPR4_ORYBR